MTDSTETHVADTRSAGISREQFLKRASQVGAGALLAGSGALTGALGATTAAAAASSTQILNAATPDDLISLDPAFSSSGMDNFVQQAVFEGLQNYVPNGGPAVANRLAQSFEVSSDGLKVNFRLRQGVEFHRGFGHVTANDVKFSFERIAGLTKPNLNSPYASDWSALDRVTTNGLYEGTVHLKTPYAPLHVTIAYLSGLVVSQKAVEQLGSKFARNPVGTGPYEFTSWTPSQRLVLTRFAQWHGSPRPAFEQIVFRPITNEQTKVIGLQTAEVDVAPLEYLSIAQVEAQSGLGVRSVPTPNFAWIGMNMLHPNLKDINVRQAIRYALDVPSMLQVGYAGKTPRANAILSPGMPVGHWADAPVYEQDLAKAKAYLAKAKVQPKNLTFTTYLSKAGASAIAQVAQANLAAIGLKATIVTKQAEMSGKQLRDQQVFYAEYGGTPPDPVYATEWFQCNQFDQWNFMYWCNKTAGALDAKALSTLNPAKRSALYIEEQRLWDQACNTVWLTWPADPWGYRTTKTKPAFYVWGDPAFWAFTAV